MKSLNFQLNLLQLTQFYISKPEEFSANVIAGKIQKENISFTYFLGDHFASGNLKLVFTNGDIDLALKHRESYVLIKSFTMGLGKVHASVVSYLPLSKKYSIQEGCNFLNLSTEFIPHSFNIPKERFEAFYQEES